jgi:6-phospho-beta-glucosidase
MKETQPYITQTTQKSRPSHHAKIAIIGGGNLYCANFIQSIIHHPETLRGCHITLMDTDEKNLSLVYTMSQQLLHHAGIDLTLDKTTHLEDAIEDSSFVITTLQTGGLEARIHDEKIPLRHGIIGHEAIGPGGFFYALRTVPVMAGIAAKMEKIVPRAFLLNYTTPITTVTEAISHSSGIRIIGINDQPDLTVRHFAHLVGLPTDHIHPRTVGMSHGNWTTALWHEGADILPHIITWCTEYYHSYPEITQKNYEQFLLAKLISSYKAIPSTSMLYYYFPEIMLDLQKKRATSPAEDLYKNTSRFIQDYQRGSWKNSPLPGDIQHGDFTLSVIHSILHDIGEELILNVTNHGAINFLADDHVVELPCHVNARGATPLTQGDGGLDMNQRGLISALAEYEGATARVALWGSRQDAIKALAANPLVMSYNKSEQIYNDLAKVHQQYLPKRFLE